jgi:hypothetical protein
MWTEPDKLLRSKTAVHHHHTAVAISTHLNLPPKCCLELRVRL